MIFGGRQTELSSLVRDNIDEILVCIIQFTNIHHKILADNIRNCRKGNFVPLYVDVDDFARVISVALSEHQRTRRLALCDSRTVRFTMGGDFCVEPQIDAEAAELIEEDFQAYIELQRSRLKENMTNNRTACALLCHKLVMSEEENRVTDDPVGNNI